MRIFKSLTILGILIISTYFAKGQSMTIESLNGTSSVMELSSIESIVFENNNLTFKTDDCEDNYFNIFFNKKMFFEVATETEDIISGSTSIVVYPNPASSFLTINKTTNDYADAYIYNVVGNVVMSFHMDNPQITINISSLPTGMYFLQINNQSIKFIVQ